MDTDYLKAVAEHLNQAVSYFDADLNLVFCNKKYLELLGFPAEFGRSGTPAAAFFQYNAERGEYGPGAVEDLVSTRINLARQNVPHSLERERPDGTVLLIQGNPTPDGGFVTTYSDITELRRSESEARRLQAIAEDRLTEIEAFNRKLAGQEALLRRLAKNLPGAIFKHTRTPDGWIKVDYISPGCLGIWELSSEALMKDASPLRQMVHADDLDDLRRSISHAVETLTPWHHQWRIITPSGCEKWLFGTGQPEPDELGGTVWYSLVLDITQEITAAETMRLALEQAELANRSKDMFLAQMSHELRTPLNAIIGFSDLMRSQALDAVSPSKYAEYAESIFSSANHLGSLIEDILNVSVPDPEIDSRTEGPIAIDDLVGFAFDTLSGASFVVDQRVTFERIRSGHRIHGPKTELRQLLLNVIGNAAKFSPRGGVVTVDLTECEDRLAVIVQDQGPGIAPDQLDRLGEPFFRGVQNPLIAKPGLGLGLYISKQIIERVGGKLSIDSRVGHGTRVTLLFPKEAMVA